MPIRLQKHIADLGICSRRKAEALILAGKVKVNGRVVREMGVKVDPAKDTVAVACITPSTPPPSRKGGTLASSFSYIALHKPVGYISSASSAQGASVLDLLTEQNRIGAKTKQILQNAPLGRVYPVGRLDKDSEGLLLLTNDGELANTLTHPRFEHEKEYEITIAGRLAPHARAVLEHGMDIGDEEYVRGIRIAAVFNKGKRTIITAILGEGKNRQIRRMFGRLGLDILSLKRTRIGRLRLGTLPVGKWKYVEYEKILHRV